MFDGLMIYGNHYSNKLLLSEITDYVESKMPGLQMKWTYKEHDNELHVPDDFDETQINIKNCKDFVCNDLEAAEKIYSLYPHWKCCKGELYVFDEKTGMWKNDKITHNLIVTRFTNQLWVGVSNRRTEMLEASKVKSYGNTTTLFNQMIEKLKTLCVDDYWIGKSQASSLGKLLFNNGYLDMQTNTFYTQFNPDIYFAGKINHDYKPFDQADEEYIESIKSRLFYEPLGKAVGDCFILNLTRGLAGDVMKRIIFGLGYGNTGKSTITKAFLKSCGDYIGTFDGNNFAYRNTGNDQASQNRWLMLLKDKRIIFSNEIKSTISLNGNAIKTVSSGGDSVVGRGHGGNEIEFNLSFLCVVFANDLPKITPYDDAVNNRTRVVSYTKPYTENPTEFELKIDYNIDAEFDTLRFQRCFVELFIRQYWRGRQGEFKDEPTEMIQAKEDWIGTEVGCISGFLRDYEITNNVDDYVRSSEIEEWIEQGKYGLTMKKFGMEIKQYTMKNKMENVLSSQKKIYGKAIRIWLGIKHIEHIIDN
jgi:phage/plasmid-associated DNA primase